MGVTGPKSVGKDSQLWEMKEIVCAFCGVLLAIRLKGGAKACNVRELSKDTA